MATTRIGRPKYKGENDNRRSVRVGPWPPTRAIAKSLGTKHYFTGVACNNGHLAPRLTSNNACMDCHNEKCGDRNKMKRQLDPEWRDEQNRKQRERYAQDPAKSKQHNKNWAAANDDHRREYQRLYQRVRREEDPTVTAAERDRMRRKREDGAYREGERLRGRERYARNPDKYRLKSRLYALNNPEVAAAQARNRRSRIAEVGGEHTADDIIKILERQKHRCVYCNADISKKYDVDHIVPISKGGHNGTGNLQCLCPTCNRQKHTLDPIEFANRKGLLL